MISGPSGVGKGTICERLIQVADADLSISMTTREPRPGEQEGISYFFVSEDKFRRNIAEGGLLEYADVFGNLYGTPKEFVLQALEAGRDVILEIDVQGALQVKENYSDGVLIFILPPSMEELRKRITGRESGAEDAIARRLGKVLEEMSYLDAYDYCVVNDIVDNAVAEIMSIMTAEHLKISGRADELIEKYGKEGNV